MYIVGEVVEEKFKPELSKVNISINFRRTISVNSEDVRGVSEDSIRDFTSVIIEVVAGTPMSQERRRSVRSFNVPSIPVVWRLVKMEVREEPIMELEKISERRAEKISFSWEMYWLTFERPFLMSPLTTFVARSVS